MFSVPVIYIFFNRPAVTRVTFARIRSVKPNRLHLIADGPRPHRPEEAGHCAECRRLVEEMIDWPCVVTRDYSDKNLGCGRRLSSGLTGAFATLEAAIVLEDDILPHPDFFPFCSTLLERYQNDSRIHAVNGFNPLGRYFPDAGAAVPTLFNNIWGWATWSRAWKDYTFDLSEWKNPAVPNQIRDQVSNDLIFHHYADGFDRTAAGQLDSWDYQWSFAMLSHRRHALVSSVNFIENIGFAQDATHTHTPEPWMRGLKTYAAPRPSALPAADQPDRMHDKLYSIATMSASRPKIALARLAARFRPFARWLAR